MPWFPLPQVRLSQFLFSLPRGRDILVFAVARVAFTGFFLFFATAGVDPAIILLFDAEGVILGLLLSLAAGVVCW